ncbi:MAG: peptidylprolyl isomerase, partial [Bdellovibrionales bacterium]|nr:peptidylprolyl isomerase [Bdellovibrionales bacterium]
TQMYAGLFGGQMGNDAQQSRMVRMSALEQLISRELASQGAQSAGLLVTDMEIKDLIVGIPAFQKDGRFSREYYQNFLMSQGLQASQFEDQLRRDILFEKARKVFDENLGTTELEAQREYQLRENKTNLSFLTIDNEALVKNNKPDAARLQKITGTPEGEKRMKDRYELEKGNYTNSEEVKARHILVKFKEGDAASEAEALKKIQAIRERVQKEDFGKVAGEVSEDLGSKSTKGDLGFFGRGKMVPAFEEVAFRLPPNQVSDPVKSPFGYHLIQVQEKKEAGVTPFEKVKDSIAAKLATEDVVAEETKQLEEAVKSGSGAPVEAFAKKWNLKWEETGLFSPSDDAIPKIGVAEAISQGAAELTSEKPWLGQVVRQGPKSFVVKLKDKKVGVAPSEKELKPIRDEISGSVGRMSFMKWTENLKEKAKIEKNDQLLRIE